MVAKQENIVICPSCGAENIEGADNCERCLSDLRSIDVPETTQVVSESDLIIPISSVRMTKPRVVAPTQTVREAVATMKDDPTGAVVVVSEGKTVGIFTDRDVLKKVAAKAGALDEQVGRYMTPDPVVLREDDTMAYALNKMGDGGFRHIPVTRDGELVGMITVRDVINWVLGRYFD
ncbi:MAG: CBS domain-containing protein [Dehalococcoidia bacterium]|jgi:CBS domain-containing protein